VIKELLLVGMGGAIGSISRYLAGIGIIRLTGPAFPFNTLFVNVVGSFLMGLIIEVLLRRRELTVQEVLHLRLLLAVGFLGGFTTFSTFSADVGALWERGSLAECALYVAASVMLSIAALFLGLFLVRRFAA